MPGLIAHEWIARHGGSENVAESMARLFPDADVATLWDDAPERMATRNVQESWLAKTPLRRSKALALPFMSATWSRVETDAYDFVLASSHVFAHHVGGRTATPKFVYVHTPARTIWAPEQDSRGANPIVRALAPMFRRRDLRFVDESVRYAANSAFIASRIEEVWGQRAEVIHPPVSTGDVRPSRPALSGEEQAILSGLPTQFLLGASRFIPYKRLDLVIEAGSRAGLPVVIAGNGPERPRLESIAEHSSVPVVIVDAPSDSLLRELYERALVFLFPAVEDFGIMPVEAMAAGTPAVTYVEGGASESVRLTGGGVVSMSLDPVDLANDVRAAAALDMGEVPGRVEDHFSERTFHRRLMQWMDISS